MFSKITVTVHKFGNIRMALIAYFCYLRSFCRHVYHTNRLFPNNSTLHEACVSHFPRNIWHYCTYLGHAVAQFFWGTALQAGRSRVRFPMVSLEFFIDLIFRSHYGPGVGSAFNRNEYQEYFLWGKSGPCVALTTSPPSCADCLEIWERQGPGTLGACPGL
jgi:hypothetical protein